MRGFNDEADRIMAPATNVPDEHYWCRDRVANLEAKLAAARKLADAAEGCGFGWGHASPFSSNADVLDRALRAFREVDK